METSSILSSPVSHLHWYGFAVAMRKRRKAGLLYIVTPPSTNTKRCAPTSTISGGKYVGAAVLARTNCQSGRSALQSGRPRALYFAKGLLLIGHGESVVTFRITMSRSVLSAAVPSVIGR